ncbi:UPF0184 domain containing protein [Asbolus verrucosus]|uniref:UPF0184 domain containing protein n=1 Tax=Asbolus verrucosus TaxID=1661398 RepID=A0A482W083_ASBVE|nr:UPF0184 domain containing protein [Asbolus verrucosus]
MGEKAHLPNENGFSNENKDNSEQQQNYENEANDDEDDMSMTSEGKMLDNQLDALNSALDDIEQKNDNIHAQLLQLLQSNREIRKQIQESNATDNEDVQGQT